MKAVLMLITAAAVGGCSSGIIQQKSNVPDEFQGVWRGQARMLVARDGTQDTVAISLRILSSGRVVGRVGGASLRGAHLAENDTWLGRFSYEGADHIIVSRFSGEIVEGLALTNGMASIPIALRNDTVLGEIHLRENEEQDLNGTVFSATDMHLRRITD